ncbi:MAG TPA: amylo-alpha-1,6-glucosidase [Vitreimonas sp.]|uniref:amylo-alpha-1,6-glucosidase n=1 Tax=Vitreimonas sp. TaxID=3069702 RepID=UPI002D2D7034|nr:amylo-alpha-1,6-glucosidase [Vitreimonas sp.]HYD86342.1 amylo-alpha-1,6-glucosidase [Vitreimonas sp.]
MTAVHNARDHADDTASESAPHLVQVPNSLQEQRPRTLKHGDTFAVYDHNGDVLAGLGSPEGLFHADTRHLSSLQLLINGARPMLLRSSLRDDNAALICDLSNPDLHDKSGRIVLNHDSIHVRRVRLLWDGAAYERVSIHNFDQRRQRLRITVSFAADFADIFEVRGAERAKRGRTEPPKFDRDTVTLSYTGLDHLLRVTQLRFDPAPRTLTASGGEYVFELEAGETFVFFFEINCSGLPSALTGRRAFFSALLASRRSLRNAISGAAEIVTSNQILNEALQRSVSDLFMLCTETPEGLYPYAGIPWFSTVFGRDALITALQTLWFDPSIALGVLRHLAANQATAFDDAADAEPGKILHELRRSEMAELGEVPFRRYYGSVDSTPLFVMLAGAYLERTGDVDSIQKLWPHIEAALGWIEHHGDRDRDGFVEYHRQTEAGLANQGWKDSHDSVFHDDGALAKGPIALVEVQAYVYGAWRAAAQIARRLGDKPRAENLSIRADAFRRRFDTHFFDEELGTYVLALDGAKRPCRVRSSNAGHALFTGVALPERSASVADALMASFSGFGIRTIAASEARYNPISYHNGSIWPHDNSMIAAGLARYGFRREAGQIFAGLFEASTYMDLRRLPELFCGFPRQRGAGPVFYPVACAPQAWAATAPLLLLQACLGLEFDAQECRISFNKPFLPSFLDEVTLSRLRVADAEVDVALKRAGSDVLLHVLRRTGDCRVVVTH